MPGISNQLNIRPCHCRDPIDELDTYDAWRYLSGMFKRYTQAQINEAERKYWMDAKAHGKTRFIWREGLIPSILIWLLVLPAGKMFVDKVQLFSLQSLVIWLILLPICVLGGYLTGRWGWQDFARKYPE